MRLVRSDVRTEVASSSSRLPPPPSSSSSSTPQVGEGNCCCCRLVDTHTNTHTHTAAACRHVGMACTRRTKTLVSTCVVLSGMTNIVCLLYVGWVTNYMASVYIKVPVPAAQRKLDGGGGGGGDTLRIMERLERLESVVKHHIQGTRVIHTIIILLLLLYYAIISISFGDTADPLAMHSFNLHVTFSRFCLRVVRILQNAQLYLYFRLDYA